MLGSDFEKYIFHLTLGVNKGDLWKEFEEEDYVFRIPLQINPENGSLIMFEEDLEEGDQIQFMRENKPSYK